MAPTPKTHKSVIDVMVIATPACAIVSPIRISIGLSLNVGSFSSMFDKHWTITNISSIPIPNSNGKNNLRIDLLGSFAFRSSYLASEME